MGNCISVGSAVCILWDTSGTHADKEGVGRESVNGMCGTSYTLKKKFSSHGEGTEDGSVNLSSRDSV